MSTPLLTRYGPWAVVAGASEGLGAAFAEQLAARGLKLVLIARRPEPLERVAERLRTEHHVEVRVVSLDLGAPDLHERFTAAVAGLEIGLLVYDAAYSKVGEFTEVSLEDHWKTIEVNCRGPVTLSHELGRGMAARGRGGILLMSSMAASQGTPLVASYGATKAFNLVLAEALWEELGRRGVDVMACRAGATRTPTYEASKPRRGVPIMEPREVAREALEALGRTPSMVPGLFNRFVNFVMGRLLSRRLAIRIMGGATRKLYGPPSVTP